MKPLIPQTVYIVQDVNNKLPSNGIVHTLERGESCSAAVYIEGRGFWVEHCKPELITHWLEKKENQYIFTKEELEEILKKAFQAGNERGWSGYPNTDNHTKPTKEQFINNLLNQQ